MNDLLLSLGMWENGNKHGKGAYYYKNGDSYDGTWKDDKKHGIGVYKIAETFTTVRLFDKLSFHELNIHKSNKIFAFVNQNKDFLRTQ